MTIEEMAGLLAAGDDFIITSHEFPDADGLGAEYALANALIDLGKRVSIYNAEPYSSAYAFIDKSGIIKTVSEAQLEPELLARSTVILVDTNDIDFTGAVADKIISLASEVLVIDHHESKAPSVAKLCLIPSFSSTCEMVYRVIRHLGCVLRDDSASALFAGIVFDTGSFAYSKTKAGTFEVALELVKAGADPYGVHGALYESSSTGVLLLRKEVLSTLELFADDRVAVQTMTSEVLTRTSSTYQDAEGLINIPLQAASVEVSVFLKENEEGTLRCSLRSKGRVNVARIAQQFGGGGHRSAAGFKSSNDMTSTKSSVLSLVLEELSGV